MTKAKQGSQTQMKTHTHILSPALPRPFPTQSQGGRKGSWSWEWTRGPLPQWRLHPAPFTPGPGSRALHAYYSGKEIAEQCGRSENGHRAQGPALVLGRLWAPTPGCPTPPHTLPPSWFPSRLAFRRPCSLPSRHPYETSDG